MAIMAGSTLSLFISITKNIFCLAGSSTLFLRWLLLPHALLPPHSESGGSLVNVLLLVFGAVAYFTGISIEKRLGLPLSLGLRCFSSGSQLKNLD
jgi:hypothetical protein